MVVLGMAMLVAGACWGYPNFVGATGLVSLPTADVQASETLVGAADVLDASRTTLVVREVYGVSSRLEIGAMLVVGVNDGLAVSAKYKFADDWAAGGTFIAANGASDDSQGYVVYTNVSPVTDAPGTVFRATAGLAIIDKAGGDSDARPFVGGQLVVSNTEVVGEYAFRNLNPFKDQIVTLAIRQRIPDKRLTAEAGFTNTNGVMLLGENVFFVGASYQWP
jgi:hypothetical protein